MLVREAGVKMGSFAGCLHMFRPLDSHFEGKRDVGLPTPRDSPFGGRTSAGIRTELSSPLVTLRGFHPLLHSFVPQPSSSGTLPRRNRFKRYFSRRWVFQLYIR